MRIKFLSVIVSFLIVSIAMSSCLDSDDNTEYSSDATVHAFGLDSVFGKHYKFSIDQLNRLIYNKDSMPVGANVDSILGRILVDTFDVTGWITAGSPTDTLFIMKDSVDLRPAVNKAGQSGMEFIAHAADGTSSRKYYLDIRVHLQDPDSLVWKDMATEGNVFSNTITTKPQRSVILNSDLLVYTSNTTVYKTSTEPYHYNWTQASISTLPSDAKLTSVINFQEKLYMATQSGDVYSSSNGITWDKMNGLSNNIVALVATFPKNELGNISATLVGIQEDSQKKRYFCTTTDGLMWETKEAVTDGFPTENIYYTALTTANGVDKVVAVGMPQAVSKITTPWFSMNGDGWAALSNASGSFCPGMENPSILYYGGMFYCFGGKLDAIYSSIAGIAWQKVEKKFLLPEKFKDKGSYSMTVDKNNFIWIVFGGNNTKNEVWRGRLNRLGFK